MREITIVVDSAARIREEDIDRYDIKIVPPNIHFNNVVYCDGIDIDAEQAYEFLEQEPDLFTTSPASPEEYANVFRKAGELSHDVVCFTVSSKISTMFNMANLAKKAVEKEIPEMSIEVIDSMTASASEGLLVLQTAKLATINQDIQSIKQFALTARQKTGVIFVMETLKHVYRTGRIPKVAARIGSLLPIKPIITITDGQAHISAVSRTMKNGIKRMREIIKNRLNNSPVMLVVQHAQVPEIARDLLANVESELNYTESYLTEFSPIMGYITGRGALGIAYYCL